jgi:Bifunctional DNA primase/polymerase, N-terminal
MPKSVLDPNPQLSYLEGDGRVKEQIARQARLALEMADRHKELPPQTAEQIEAERFQYESNEYAAVNARYSAARAAAVNFLVVPLDGTTPLVDPSEATREPRKLLTWWAEHPEANPGVALGRIGGIWALRVEDNEAWERLKEMTAVPMRDPDRDRTWTEYRDLGGARVRLHAPSRPFSVRSRGGWGRDFDRAAAELAQESRNRNPQTFFLVWSYPSVQSGVDAFDYKSRTIATGLRVLGEGEVLPWSGSVLQDGVTVQAPMSRPPEAPVWLAKVMGRARPRKAMAAQREQFEAMQRANEAHVMGLAELIRKATQEAAEKAVAEAKAAAEAAR